MNLENLIFIPRLRKPWEALDLGFKLVPRFWWPLLISWLIISLPIFLLACSIDMVSEYAIWVIWWLKPLFERMQLYILSIGILGNQPGWRDAIKRLPTYIGFQLFAALTWRRFSATRSFDLPLSQLERIKGATRKKRLEALHQKSRNPASWLTVVLLHIETILMLSLFMLAMMFLPQSVDMGWEQVLEEHVWLGNLIYYLGVAVVAPFYVASGFMLYVNRRIELEAWDIELGFKQIASQYKSRISEHNVVDPISKPKGGKQTGSNTNSIALALLISLSAFTVSETTVAETQEGLCETQSCIDQQEVKRAKADILTVFEHDDFHQIETVRIPRWLDELSFERDEENEIEDSGFPESLGAILRFIALSIEFVIWGLAIFAVVFLIVRYRSLLSRFVVFGNKEKKSTFEMPKTMFGLDVRKDQLPEDIQSASLAFLEKGDYRACLSLLYRATISKLIHDYQVPFSASSTELECLALSKPLTTRDGFAYFSELTQVWRRSAYGHIQPSAEQVRLLCQTWSESMETSSQQAEGGHDSE